MDDTRELLDNVQYAAARGRFKVYLIDEVHMLSKSSFNALLKTLEEPPEHVKFLLATTDPQKLPATVLSRCLQFNLKRMTPALISERLKFICGEENIDAEAEALALLARAADGSMRDALSLLDQAIAYCGGTISTALTAKMLGTIDRDHIKRLLERLAGNDAKGILDLVAEIDEQFPDYGRLLDDLARCLQRIAVYQVVGASDLDDEFRERELSDLAESMPAEDVQLYYQIAIVGRRDLHLAPDSRSGAEMVLLRMLAFRPAGEPAASGGQAENRGSAVSGAAHKAAPKVAVTASASQRQAPVSPSDTAGASPQAWSDPDWGQLVGELGWSGAVRLLAGNCAFLERQGDTLYLGLDPRSESLLTAGRKDEMAKALSAHFGEELRLNIRVGSDENETPQQQESRLENERLHEAQKVLEADPNIQQLKSMFGAELNADTIEIISGDKG